MNDLESRLRAALHDETAELTARPDLADDMVTRGTMVRRRRRVVGGAAGLVVLAALFPVWKAIDTSSAPLQPAQPTPTTVHQSPPPSTPTTPTPPTTQSPPVWSTEAQDVLHSPASVPIVTALRVGEHDNYDRVVIDLSGPMSSYHIHFVPRFVADGSGAIIHVPGAAFLAIRFEGADAHTATGQGSFQGHAKHIYPYSTLKGTVFTGDFESNASFGLALSHRAVFRVLELTSPTRLVIDLHH